jgi:DNA gyrase subunit A
MVFYKVDGSEFVKSKMKTYSKAVLQDRALPDVQDGLKPIHRRIIYSMYKNGWTSNKPFVKCAKIIGYVIGTHSPHGDASAYDALTKMTTNFTLNQPLLDKHGNMSTMSSVLC